MVEVVALSDVDRVVIAKVIVRRTLRKFVVVRKNKHVSEDESFPVERERDRFLEEREALRKFDMAGEEDRKAVMALVIKALRSRLKPKKTTRSKSQKTKIEQCK